MLTIEFIAAEDRYQLEPTETISPEALFDRRWAFDLVGEAMGRLEHDYVSGGKAELHSAMQPYLATPATSAVCEQIGKALGMSRNAVEVALHRFRQRFRKRLQGLVCETVASPEDVDDELRHVVSLFAAG